MTKNCANCAWFNISTLLKGQCLGKCHHHDELAFASGRCSDFHPLNDRNHRPKFNHDVAESRGVPQPSLWEVIDHYDVRT